MHVSLRKMANWHPKPLSACDNQVKSSLTLRAYSFITETGRFSTGLNFPSRNSHLYWNGMVLSETALSNLVPHGVLFPWCSQICFLKLPTDCVIPTVFFLISSTPRTKFKLWKEYAAWHHPSALHPSQPGPPRHTGTGEHVITAAPRFPFCTQAEVQWVPPWALLSLHLTMSLELISHQYVKSFLRFYTLT